MGKPGVSEVFDQDDDPFGDCEVTTTVGGVMDLSGPQDRKRRSGRTVAQADLWYPGIAK